MNRKLKLSFLFSFVLAGIGITLAACNGDNVQPILEPSSSESQGEEDIPDVTPDEVPDHTHVWGQPTWTWTEEQGGYKAFADFTCATDSTHTERVNAAVSKKVTQPSCTTSGEAVYTAALTFAGKDYVAKKTVFLSATGHHLEEEWTTDKNNHWHICEDCDEPINKEPHLLETRLVNESGSTCTVAGEKVEETYCSVCGKVVQTTTKSYKLKQHNYSIKITEANHDDYEIEDFSVAPTCTTGGYTIWKCEDCNATMTETLSALGHDWDHAPTCTEGSTCQRQGCDAKKSALGHDYELKSHSDPTCTVAGTYVYECATCHDEYTDIIPELGHDFGDNEWEICSEDLVENTTCDYVYTYRNHCTTCDHPVYSTDDTKIVKKHTMVAQITEHPTCNSTGTKEFRCSKCGLKDTEHYPDVVLPKNDNHTWVLDTTKTNTETVKNYKCSVCGEEKTVIDSSASVAATVDKSDIEGKEIALQEATLELNEAARSTLQEGDVTLKVEKVTDTSEIELTAEARQRLGNNPVFDFSVNDGSHEFGENGKVKVRIPYELQAGDDPDKITIFYVNNNGELEVYEAVYEELNNDGYAVFETNHFSYYTVAFLTPAEKCEIAGHVYGAVTTIEPTCTSDGYSYKACQRCGHTETFKVKPALGHDYQVNPSSDNHDATCTEAGHTYYKCSRCNDSYDKDLPALGHDYELKSHSDPTCTGAGTYVYECATCHDTYTEIIPALGHHYVAEVTEATCEHPGAIRYVCDQCGPSNPGHEDTARQIDLEQLPHSFILDELQPEEDDDYHFHCEYDCGATKDVSKNNKIDRGYAQTNSYFTNIVHSFVGEEVTLKSGHSHIDMTIGNQDIHMEINNAEAHIGLDANNQILAYGKADLNVPMANINGEVAFYIKDGMLYYKQGDVSSNVSSYIMIDLSEISMGSTMKLGDILDRIPQIMDYLKNDVRPYLEGIVEDNKESLENTAFDLFSAFMKYSSTADGFVIEVDFNKIASFYDNLQNKSIREVYDSIFGEGSLDDLLDLLADYMDMPLYDALQRVKQETGIDYLEVIQLINKGVKVISDNQYDTLAEYIYSMTQGAFDLEEFLQESFLKKNSIVSLVKDNSMMARMFGDKTIAQYVRTTIKDYVGRNLFELLTNEMGVSKDMLDPILEQVGGYIDALKVSSFIKIETDKEGKFIGSSIKVNFDKDIAIDLNLDIKVGANFISTFDYQSLINICNSVNNIVYKENFATDEKIRAFFGDDVEYITDANNKIIRVSTQEISNYDRQYSSEAEKEHYRPVVVYDEQDLFQYTNYTYYPRLVELYKQYNESSIITLTAYDTLNEYNYTHFGATKLMFSEECANTFNVQFEISSNVERKNYGIQVKIQNKSTNKVSTYSLYNYSYRSGASFATNTTVSTSEGKSIESSGSHEWKLIDEPELACGETGYRTYVCTNCGKKKTEQFTRTHAEPELISYELKNSEGKCTEGVIAHMHCAACNTNYDVTYRRGLEGNEYHGHAMNFEANHLVIGGINFYTPECLCGEEVLELTIEGYAKQHEPSSLVDNEEQQHEVVLYQSNTDPNKYIGVEYYVDKVTSKDCTYQRKAKVYLDFDVTDFEHRFDDPEIINVGSEYQQHNISNDLHYEDFVYDEENRKYNASYHCSDCEYVEDYELDQYDYVELLVPYSMIGINENGYILAHGTAYRIFEEKMVDYLEYDSLYDRYDHEWHEMPGDYKGNYVVFNINNQPYMIANKEALIKVGCEARRTCAYYFGFTDLNDIVGTAKATFYQGYMESYMAHDINATPTTYTDNNLGIKFIVTKGVCSVCGEETYDTSIQTINPQYTESQEVRSNGIITHYPAGYEPIKGITGVGSRYSGDSMWVENTNTGEETRIRNTFTAENYYYKSEGQLPTFTHYVETSKSKMLSEESYHRTVEEISTSETYVVRDGRIELDYSSTNSSYNYFPFYKGDKFASLFKEITGFDFNLQKYGCAYMIRESVYTNNQGYTETRAQLEVTYEHLKYVGTEATCTQAGIGVCEYCNKEIVRQPYGHGFSQYGPREDMHWRCWSCGLDVYEDPFEYDDTHTKRSNPSFSIEILRDKDGGASQDDILIGYYDNKSPLGSKLDDLGYDVVFTLESYEGDRQNIDLGFEENDSPKTSYLTISKQDIIDEINYIGMEHPQYLNIQFIGSEAKTYGIAIDATKISSDYAPLYTYMSYNLQSDFEGDSYDTESKDPQYTNVINHYFTYDEYNDETYRNYESGYFNIFESNKYYGFNISSDNEWLYFTGDLEPIGFNVYRVNWNENYESYGLIDEYGLTDTRIQVNYVDNHTIITRTCMINGTPFVTTLSGY